MNEKLAAKFDAELARIAELRRQMDAPSAGLEQKWFRLKEVLMRLQSLCDSTYAECRQVFADAMAEK